MDDGSPENVMFIGFSTGWPHFQILRRQSWNTGNLYDILWLAKMAVGLALLSSKWGMVVYSTRNLNMSDWLKSDPVISNFYKAHPSGKKLFLCN